MSYIDRDNEKALEIIIEVEKAALLSGDTLWVVKSSRVKGQILYRSRRIAEAIIVLEQAMGIARRNRFTREERFVAGALGTAFLFTNRLIELYIFTCDAGNL